MLFDIYSAIFFLPIFFDNLSDFFLVFLYFFWYIFFEIYFFNIFSGIIFFNLLNIWFFSPPVRWGFLDFMYVLRLRLVLRFLRLLRLLLAVISARLQYRPPGCSGQRRASIASSRLAPDLNRGALERTGQHRTSPGQLWSGLGNAGPQLSEDMSEEMSEIYQSRMSEDMSEKDVRRYVNRNIRKNVRKECQKKCQKICQKKCQKIYQKICQRKSQ